MIKEELDAQCSMIMRSHEKPFISVLTFQHLIPRPTLICFISDILDNHEDLRLCIFVTTFPKSGHRATDHPGS